MSDQKRVALNINGDPGTIVIPSGMSLQDALEELQSKINLTERTELFRKEVNVLPFEGAVALIKSANELYERVEISDGSTSFVIEVSPGETINVPWGNFTVKGIEGVFQTSAQYLKGRYIFQVLADIKVKHKSDFDALIKRMQEILVESSIYRGKAFQLEFTDSTGSRVSFISPQILNLSDVVSPSYTEETRHRIDTEILSLFQYTSIALSHGISLKRGILLEGPYGTGKSALTKSIAREAIENGWTVIYVPRARDLKDALIMARDYQPALVMVEDLDSLSGTYRDRDMNELLNIMSGIDGGLEQVMLIATTNELGEIHPAMLRDGRIDSIIHIGEADAESAASILRSNIQSCLGDDIDFDALAKQLIGLTGATIAKIAKRAMTYWLFRTHGEGPFALSHKDLQDAIDSAFVELGIRRDSHQSQGDGSWGFVPRKIVILTFGDMESSPDEEERFMRMFGRNGSNMKQ